MAEWKNLSLTMDDSSDLPSNVIYASSIAYSTFTNAEVSIFFFFTSLNEENNHDKIRPLHMVVEQQVLYQQVIQLRQDAHLVVVQLIPAKSTIITMEIQSFQILKYQN